MNAATVDRIVANVLKTISTTRAAQAAPVVADKHIVEQNTIEITATVFSDPVVTAELLEKCELGQAVELIGKAIVTPAAQDIIRERRLNVTRTQIASKKTLSAKAESESNKRAAVIVHHTAAIDQVLGEFGVTTRELVGCPDDAAKFAISELCRGAVSSVVIFAEQTHRAACLANRNDKIKAVAIRDQADVNAIKKQLRANVWCLDPTGRSYFELRNIFKSIPL